jgi:predicted regulator of Ras-like GTPase activity (Roadblock/LC7/MglB family)
VERLKRALDSFVAHRGALGVVLVDYDGLLVASSPMPQRDAEALGALGAAVFSAVSKTAKTIGLGSLLQSNIDCSLGAVYLKALDHLLLVALVQRDADPDAVLRHMNALLAVARQELGFGTARGQK